MNYKTSLKAKRIDYIIYTIILLVDTKDYNVKINHLNPMILQAECNINIMYQGFKKNELSVSNNSNYNQRVIRNNYHITKNEKDSNNIITNNEMSSTNNIPCKRK